MTDADAPDAGAVVVRVWYDGDPGWLDVAPVEADVVGRSDERFVDALARTFGEWHESSYSLVVRDGRDTLSWLGEITEHVTLGDAAAVAGGQVLQVDVSGRGGGPIPLMWDIVSAGLTVAGVVDGGRRAKRMLDAARLRNRRQVARDWVNAGTNSPPPIVLRRAVNEQDPWRRRDFDRVFGLSLESGAALLRACNYRQVSSRPEVWRWIDPDA